MPIKLVVGLGNPGEKYQGTRHNIGRQVVEALQGAPLNNISWLVTKSYMNESGLEVARKAKYSNIAPDEILVVLDEFQIPLRKMAIHKKGSDGGHNGLKSVIDCLGTDQVPRMRIGIGPLTPNEDSADFVLKRFSSSEKIVLDQVMPKFEKAVIDSIQLGLDAAMNKYNGTWLENA